MAIGIIRGCLGWSSVFWGSPIQWWHCSRALLTGCGWMNAGSQPWHSSMSEINIQVCEPHGCRNICLKHLYSYKMVLLLSTTSPYKMSWHDLLKKNTAFFGCFITVSWAYTMPQKTKFDDLTEWVGPSNPYKMKLQNLQFGLLGSSLTKCFGDGVSCKYKMAQYKPSISRSPCTKM